MTLFGLLMLIVIVGLGALAAIILGTIFPQIWPQIEQRFPWLVKRRKLIILVLVVLMIAGVVYAVIGPQLFQGSETQSENNTIPPFAVDLINQRTTPVQIRSSGEFYLFTSTDIMLARGSIQLHPLSEQADNTAIVVPPQKTVRVAAQVFNVTAFLNYFRASTTEMGIVITDIDGNELSNVGYGYPFNRDIFSKYSFPVTIK